MKRYIILTAIAIISTWQTVAMEEKNKGPLEFALEVNLLVGANYPNSYKARNRDILIDKECITALVKATDSKPINKAQKQIGDRYSQENVIGFSDSFWWIMGNLKEKLKTSNGSQQQISPFSVAWLMTRLSYYPNYTKNISSNNSSEASICLHIDEEKKVMTGDIAACMLGFVSLQELYQRNYISFDGRGRLVFTEANSDNSRDGSSRRANYNQLKTAIIAARHPNELSIKW